MSTEGVYSQTVDNREGGHGGGPGAAGRSQSRSGTQRLRGQLKIDVRLGRSSTYLRADLVHVATGPLDTALVKIDPADIQRVMREERVPLSPARFAESPRIGQRLLVLGYGLFAPSTGVKATATGGCLSKIVKVRGHEVMAHTCADVHRGNSGGMVCIFMAVNVFCPFLPYLSPANSLFHFSSTRVSFSVQRLWTRMGTSSASSRATLSRQTGKSFPV